MTDTAARVRKILIEHLCLDAPQCLDEAQITRDLGADSLDIVELQMAFEDEFKAAIPESREILPEFTVAQIINLIADLIK